MGRLLPSSKDTSAADEADPRVVGVDSDEADDLLSALSSNSAREVLTALHEEPDTPSGLAERLGMTLQNVQYHLGNLSDADLIEVVDTVYSEKGREMDVYAPADRPLVVFAGDESASPNLRDALKRLVAGIGLLAVASAAVQAWLRGLPDLGLGAETGGGAAAGDAAEATGTATPKALEATTAAAADAAGGFPPGALFFLGGLAVLLVATAAWYLPDR